jgi:hypothetical protein
MMRHADLRQVFLDELHAARNMHGRVFGAVGVLGVLAAADVAAVVVQSRDDAEPEQALGEGPGAFRAHAPVHQPRHAQRHVEHMLEVVVIRVALAEAGILAPVEAREVGERLREIARGVLLEEVPVNAADRLGYDLRIGGVDPVGDVVIAASLRFCRHSALEKTRASFDGITRVLNYNEIDHAMRRAGKNQMFFAASVHYCTRALTACKHPPRRCRVERAPR